LNHGIFALLKLINDKNLIDKDFAVGIEFAVKMFWVRWGCGVLKHI